MSFEHPGHGLDRSQATSDGPAIRASKDVFGLCGVKTAPEFAEQFLDLPGSGDLASTGAQRLKLQPVELVPILGIL